MADQKVSALTELTTFSGDETFYVVEDDDGTPVSRRVTIENLAAGLVGTIPARSCRVYRSGALSLANNGTTAIAWDAESWDPYSMHDLVTNPSRVTLDKVGKWECHWALAYEANATGVRDASLALNGTVVSVQEKPGHATTANYLNGSDIVECSTIGDYVEVVPFQNSGASRAFSPGSGQMFLSVAYLGS